MKSDNENETFYSLKRAQMWLEQAEKYHRIMSSTTIPDLMVFINSRFSQAINQAAYYENIAADPNGIPPSQREAQMAKSDSTKDW